MNSQTILVVAFVVIVAATAYFWFQEAESPEITETSESVQNLDARLQELRHLKDIHLDTSVLQDKFFQSLSLPAIPPLPDLKIGRANPFIPFKNGFKKPGVRWNV